MSLLEDFKTTIGETETSNDALYIRTYLQPILDIASKYFDRSTETSVSFNGSLEYDLTDASVASPVVGAAGIQTIRVLQSELSYFTFGVDYRIKDRTSLYFPDSHRVPTGTRVIRYNPYFSTPVAAADPDPYVETDAPSEIFPYLIDWAEAHYQIKQIMNTSNNLGIEEKREANMSVKYGNVGTRIKLLEGVKSASIAEIMALGNNAYGLYSMGIF